VTFVAGSGVTLDAPGNVLTLNTQFLTAELTPIISPTNVWLIEPNGVANGGAAGSPAAIVQQNSIHVSSTSHSVSLPANPTVGNLIVVPLRSVDSAAGISLPGGWNIVSGGLHFGASSFVSVGIAYKVCTTPAVDKTFTWTTTAASIGDAGIFEIANLTGTLDQTNFFDQTSNSTALTCQTGSITPTSNKQFVAAVCCTGGNAPKTIDSGFTLLDAASLFNAEIGFQLITSTTSLNPTFGWASPGQRAIAMIASFS
jgi:hypothetical protein